MIQKMLKSVVLFAVLMTAIPAAATKTLELKVIDKNYLMVHFRDGEVHYRDDGTGPSAYLGHSFSEGDDTLLVFGERLKADRAQQASLWKISSVDDKAFGNVRPKHVWRKSKPMNFDHTLTGELDHWLFLQLPKAMTQGCTYTVTIPKGIGADMVSLSVCFDIWNAQSEAVHVNIIGYVPSEQTHAADLYQWLGDGGQRDYKDFEGRQVYLYNVNTKEKLNAGTVKFWKPASAAEQEAGKKALIGTDVWNIDFCAAAPGRYRLVVEDVGCSMDFDISPDVYFQPYRYSVRGYYYMRLGEPKDPAHVWPVPRQPQFIPDQDPKEFTVYKTDLTPWSPEWRQLRTDVWDEPHFKKAEASIFWQHRLPGNPVNTIVRGGHSDAFDWDRHLAHVSNIYDMLLPFILTDGRLIDDNLGIRESGNGIPDLIDEARNEVDFFLSIRDGEAYSQGVTNPSSDWTVMFQAGCTTMAAWANAANCAVLAEAFRLQHNDSLQQYYTREAITAFRFAEKQENQQLDDMQDVGSIQMRGRDFRQLAAAFLYNLTGEQEWETAFAEESMIKGPNSPLFSKGRQGFFGIGVTNQFGASDVPFCQVWAAAAYLTCPHPRHHATLYENLCSSINAQAESYNISHMAERPSRRSANDSRWQVSQNLQLVMLAHYMADNARKRELEHVMFTEAGWALGRNPGNIVEMTGLGERHITDCYTTGRNDGAPECHPGQTPFNGTETWSPGHNGGDAQVILKYCYPEWNNGWPRQESYFNQRYFWVNGEFTPRETMRGKMALLGYLNVVAQQQKSIVVLYDNDVHCAVDGYATVAGLRDAIAQSDTACVALVSCGDFLQGAVAGSLSKGQYVVDILRNMGYDAMGLGNHEFDYGVPRLRELLDQLETPIVCANFFESGSPIPFYTPYIIRQYGGRRIAFVGAVTGEAMRAEAYSFYDDNGLQLYDLKPMEVSRIVQQAVDEARSKGADYVVLISHLGEQPVANTVNSHELVARTRGIDVVLDGHSHSTIPYIEAPNLDGRMIPVSQTGTALANIGKLLITPDGCFVTQLLPLKDISYKNSRVAAVTDSIKTLMAKVTAREICRSDFDLSIYEADGKTRRVRTAETNIGDLVADAFRVQLKTDIGLQNGGGIRNSIPKGAITYGSVLDALPFGNLMMTLEATGQQIVDMLQKCATFDVEDGSFPQVSGLQFKIRQEANGRSVSDVAVLDAKSGQFKPINLARRYTIATTEYTVKGGFYDTMKSARVLSTTSQSYCDCLVDFLRTFSDGKLPAIYAQSQNRITFANSDALVTNAQKVTSPNGHLSAKTNDKKLVIEYKNQQVLELTDIPYTKLDFVKKVKDDYQMLEGKRLHCTNEANEYQASIGPDAKIVMRLYNDGIAFRYEYTNLQNSKVPAEQTAYVIPEGTKRWMQQWSDGYEGFFPLSTTAEVKTLGGFGGSMEQKTINTHWGYPLLLEVRGERQEVREESVFALITEANIERRQSASSLFNKGEVFNVRQDQNDLLLTGDWHTPWRVVIIGTLADIVQSTLVTDVSEPSKYDDVNWIKPGVVSWIYWAYNHGSNDYNIIKKYVDMAVTLKLPYVLIDAEWDEMDKVASNEGKTIEDAVKYAVSKGVKPLIWYNSSIGWVNGAPGPKYRLNKPEDREKEFAWCEKIGVAGVKIDFFSGDNQANMDYCQDLLESAARHHLLVNFHGAPIPRGWQRTYPNLLSTEGVYGAEWYNNVPHFTKKAASHNAMLPFTRNVIGPMDYTPCAFSDSQHPHITSNAHELALTVLFESGLQHLADRPESFLAQPQEVQDFLGKLPTVWDETRFVSGYPGESAVLARRSGKTWYVAGINGSDEPQTLAANLGFIGKGKALMFADDASGKWQIGPVSKLPSEVRCQPRGGFVLVISK